MHAHGFQAGELAHSGQRCLSGGDNAILRIAINKDLHLAAGHGALRHVATWHEDLAMMATVEIDTLLGFFEDGESVVFADVCHVQVKYAQGLRWGRRILPGNHILSFLSL